MLEEKVQKILNLRKDENSKTVHTVWHSFCGYMKRWYYKKFQGYKKDLTQSKRQYKMFDSTNMVGYRAMCRIARYAKNKEDIFITGCDDNCFMGSSILLITHENKNEFMGTTIILMPQSKYEINQVFLYPGHLDSLMKKLKEIQRRAREKNKDWYDEEYGKDITSFTTKQCIEELRLYAETLKGNKKEFNERAYALNFAAEFLENTHEDCVYEKTIWEEDEE